MVIEKNINKWILTIISSLYVFEYTTYGLSINSLKYVFYILLLIPMFANNKSYIMQLPRVTMLIFMLLCFVILPMMQSIINFEVAIAVYAIVMGVFILATYLIGRTMKIDRIVSNYIAPFAVLGTIIVLVCFVINYQNLFNISAIMSNFRSHLELENVIRERSAFGFMHVNTLGGVCMALIIALTMVSVERPRAKMLKNIAIAFNFLIMLNTGSRSSVIGVICYFVVLICEKIYYKSSSTFRLLFRLLLIGVGIYIASIVNTVLTDNYELANMLTSGRLAGWIYDLKQMTEDRTLLFGYGQYNPSAFFSQPFANGMIVDNWYVFMITNIGIVGFGGCIVIIVNMISSLIRICKHNPQNSLVHKALALVLANLFHAMAEKAFITPADPISYLMVTVVFAVIFAERDMKHKEKNYENSIS